MPAWASADVVYGWGYNHYGQVGDATTTTPRMLPVPAVGLNANVSAVAAGGGQSLAIENGALYAWGGAQGVNPDNSTFDNPMPTAVTLLPSGVTAISAGQAHSLARRNKNGTVFFFRFRS